MKSLDLNPSLQLSGCWLSSWSSLSAVSSSIRPGQSPLIRVVETKSDIHMALGPSTSSYDYRQSPLLLEPPWEPGASLGCSHPASTVTQAGRWRLNGLPHAGVLKVSRCQNQMSSWEPTCKSWVISRLSPFLPRGEKRGGERRGNRSTEIKNQKAKSKRARRGQVGQIIKDMYKEATEVKSSRESWQQPQKAPGGTVVPGKGRNPHWIIAGPQL